MKKYSLIARAALLALVLIAVATTASAVSLIDQITGQTLGPNAESSQHFGPPNASFDIAQIDDFLVGGSGFTLDSVDAVFLGFSGFTSYNNVTAWNIEIYSSPAAAAGNLDGDVVHLVLAAGDPNISITTGFVGGDPLSALVSFNVSSFGLSVSANLTYYLAVIPQLDFGTGGQIGVVDSSGGTPGGMNAFQTNPGGGFGFPGNTMGNNTNAAYRVNATAVPEPSTTFSLILGVTLLSGLVFVRRRSASRE